MSNPGSGSDHYNIPLLDKNGSNYDNWKFRVFALLKIKGLMEIVRGIEKCPPEKATDPKDQVAVRATGHKAPGESSVNITVSSYDTTHLQENPQRLG